MIVDSYMHNIGIKLHAPTLIGTNRVVVMKLFQLVCKMLILYINSTFKISFVVIMVLLGPYNLD
jgi:hypothetical protein